MDDGTPTRSEPPRPAGPPRPDPPAPGREAARAVEELAAVLGPGAPGSAGGEGDRLFGAARAVGSAQGIELRPAPAWEDSTTEDPVERLARVSRLRCRKVALRGEWWRRDGGPILAFVGPERDPVALLPAAPGRYRLFDPASRRHVPVDAPVAETVQAEAYVFYRPLPERAGRIAELLRFAVRGRGRDLGAALLAGVAATLLGMATPQATAVLVDRAIPDARPSLLWQLGLGLAAAALGGAMFRLAQGLAMLRMEAAVDAALQSALWDRLLGLPLSFFRRYTTGDLQARAAAAGRIRAYLGGTTLRTLFGSVLLMLNLGLLLHYSPRLTLVALGVAACTAGLTIVSGVLLLRCSRRIMEQQGRFLGLLVQLVQGVPKLRVAAAEERAFARWAREYTPLVRLELQRRNIQDTVRAINVALSAAGAIVLFGAAATLLQSEAGITGLSTGRFLAFHVAFGTLVGAVVALSNTVTDVLTVDTLLERARPILETVPEIEGRRADPGRLQGRVALDDVSFRYRDDGPYVLEGVSLEAEPGSFLALVGPSGGGKSTLVRVLLGFETPLAGGVYYDGQDLAGLDLVAVRRQLGVVLQHGRIGAGSLLDNIAGGTVVSLNDAWQAARSAGFADEIETMPMGMHTIVSEGGTNLSGGQRQRLLLARALVHRPRILVLDEATSALDNETQRVVADSLERLEVTRIVIAHRLSTIRRADRIYVLQTGRIVQQGSHDQLITHPGPYANLVSRQQA